MNKPTRLQQISNKELAECIGKKPAFASQVRMGKRKLPIRYCSLVSERFGIPISELRPDIANAFNI